MTSHRFVLIRHAEATCNNLGGDAMIDRYDTDSALTALGRKQARLLAAQLPPTMVGNMIFSSPLRRAVQTADCIASAHGCALRIDDRLAEMRVEGIFSPPLTVPMWDAMIESRVTKSRVKLPPGVEPLADQDRRVRAFLGDRYSTCGVESLTLIVAHAFTIELALVKLLGLSLSVLRRFRFRLSNSGVHVVDYHGSAKPARLMLVNCTSHLRRWI